jgi:DNA-binding NarL/FixJ family response regulator
VAIRRIDMKTEINKEAGSAPLRAIVADDDPLARRVIRDTLQRDGISVVAEASNGREAVELALYYTPDVVVMDYMMPEVDGLEATRQLYAAAPDVRIVLLTGADERDVGLQGIDAGASGFISKDVDLNALPRALRGSANGEAAISRRLAMTLVKRLHGSSVAGQGLRPIRSPLTDREWEVLDLICSGADTEAIADTLVLSTETVRTHLKNLYRKLGVRSRAEAVQAGIQLRQRVAV